MILLDLLPAGVTSLEGVTLASIFVAVVLIVLAAAALLVPQDAVSRRYAGGLGGHAGPAVPAASLRVAAGEERRRGIWGFVLPADDRERLRVRRKLWRAGFQGPHAVRNYFLLRTGLALLLPFAVALILLFTSFRIDSGGLRLDLAGVPITGPLLLILVLAAIGFYGPLFALRLRIDARQQAIRRAFPSALDLMQLAVEAGLGVDAATARIAEEMALAQPALAHEFGRILVELRAGKPRDVVLADFADRTGVEEIRSFVAVLQQTVEFGTDMAEALRTFAAEMRKRRMLLAEEKANKLSVKLSGVVVILMLPAVLAMIMGPIVIRVIRVIMPALGGH